MQSSVATHDSEGHESTGSVVKVVEVEVVDGATDGTIVEGEEVGIVLDSGVVVVETDVVAEVVVEASSTQIQCIADPLTSA